VVSAGLKITVGQRAQASAGDLSMGMSLSGLQRRLQKLELRSLAHTMDAQPEGYWKRLLMERLEVMSQRLQAARDRGEYVPPGDVGHVKEWLRAWLDRYEMRAK
jgi:hypothetical protein